MLELNHAPTRHAATLVRPALGRWRQEDDRKLEASLVYEVSSRPAGPISTTAITKQNIKALERYSDLYRTILVRMVTCL